MDNKGLVGRLVVHMYLRLRLSSQESTGGQVCHGDFFSAGMILRSYCFFYTKMEWHLPNHEMLTVKGTCRLYKVLNSE